MKLESLTKKITKETTIAIWGGGAAGVGAGIELDKMGFNVRIYEKNSELLSGSSNATPGRAGHGYHYIHPETGILYLKSTIHVMRKYPECTLGYNLPESHYLRHGLYFIMKSKEELNNQDKRFSSVFPKEEILKTYEKLREAYAELIKEDEGNKIFGEPEQFFKVYESESELERYKNLVDISKVSAVVDTREELINWPKLRDTLLREVQKSNITVYTNTTISKPHYHLEKIGFNFFANEKLEYADYIVNSTWEEIEYLNNEMNFYMTPNSRTNRLKAIITVTIEDTLLEESPSMFFCMGPHAMFSNMGNGLAMVTFAPETNMKYCMDLRIDDEMRSYLDKKKNPAHLNEKAKKILEGLSNYIPEMRDQEIKKIAFGVIKTVGSVDLLDPDSDVHRRDSIWVRRLQIGMSVNGCLKLLHFLENASDVAALIQNDIEANKRISSIKKNIMSKGFGKPSRDLRKMTEIHLQRNFSPDELLPYPDALAIEKEMISSVLRKKEIKINGKQKETIGSLFSLVIMKVCGSDSFLKKASVAFFLTLSFFLFLKLFCHDSSQSVFCSIFSQYKNEDSISPEDEEICIANTSFFS